MKGSDPRALALGGASPDGNTLTMATIVQPDQAGRIYHHEAVSGSLGPNVFAGSAYDLY